MVTRKCRGCGKIKPLSAFGKNKRVSSGRTYQCKPCTNTYHRILKNKNPEKRREEGRHYYREHKQERNAYSHRREQLFPERRKAYYKVDHAKTLGILVPGQCDKCGLPATEAHHEDYTKPLEIIWLCSSCHGLLHARLRARREDI